MIGAGSGEKWEEKNWNRRYGKSERIFVIQVVNTRGSSWSKQVVESKWFFSSRLLDCCNTLACIRVRSHGEGSLYDAGVRTQLPERCPWADKSSWCSPWGAVPCGDVEGEHARAVGRESGRGSLWEFPASVNELSENEEHDGHLERGEGVK